MDREKQIEEMAEAIFQNCNCGLFFSEAERIARFVIEEQGYRKQSEGCEFCGTTLYVKAVQHTMPLLAPITRADELRHESLNLTGEIYLPLEAKFCPVCGKKMKGVQSDGEVY